MLCIQGIFCPFKEYSSPSYIAGDIVILKKYSLKKLIF